METLIPILIAIVVFAFQAYANFQKEQEKARKRNFGQPPLPEENAKRPVDVSPKEMTVEQRPSTRHPAFENYSGAIDADEVKRVRKARQQRTVQRLEVMEDTAAGAFGNERDFDLRDAIIKSAILERPYQ
ncbi:hypothetical protein [Parapedobacter koreensis]|uniref:Uncharacterized protein n=1 Tax=Parapedobacter koreensis TaxID=332977 RepID=A0A1H7GE10_9SPHI|nr:hypothetical protein [Parapedobacter koreensis]SEK35092.1 hypothetical protein SAMN05421740_101627 [Parapedobacter koreensis]